MKSNSVKFVVACAVCFVLTIGAKAQNHDGVKVQQQAGASSPAKSDWTVRGHIPVERFIIQSHRGAGELAPENTIESFELGWKLGTYPESDVRTTKDGVIVAFHDANFARVVKDASEELKKKGVRDLTWGEVVKLDVGAFRGEQFKGQKVIRLEQVFERMTGHPDRHLYLDIKEVDFEKLASQVKKHKVEAQVVLASTKYDQIRKWKQLVPQSDTLLWMGGTEEQLRKRFDELAAANFADVTQLQVHVRLKPDAKLHEPDPFTLDDEFLIQVGNDLRSRKILYQTLPWGAADPLVYRKLLDLGVMSFATDHPEVTREAVRRYIAGEAEPKK